MAEFDDVVRRSSPEVPGAGLWRLARLQAPKPVPPVRAPRKERGRGVAVTVFAWGFHRQYAGSLGRARWSGSSGLSASVAARLKGRWMEEYRLWRRSKLG